MKETIYKIYTGPVVVSVVARDTDNTDCGGAHLSTLINVGQIRDGGLHYNHRRGGREEAWDVICNQGLRRPWAEKGGAGNGGGSRVLLTNEFGAAGRDLKRRRWDFDARQRYWWFAAVVPTVKRTHRFQAPEASETRW
jgi:hypothetical protein